MRLLFFEISRIIASANAENSTFFMDTFHLNGVNSKAYMMRSLANCFLEILFSVHKEHVVAPYGVSITRPNAKFWLNSNLKEVVAGSAHINFQLWGHPSVAVALLDSQVTANGGRLFTKKSSNGVINRVHSMPAHYHVINGYRTVREPQTSNFFVQ